MRTRVPPSNVINNKWIHNTRKALGLYIQMPYKKKAKWVKPRYHETPLPNHVWQRRGNMQSQMNPSGSVYRPRQPFQTSAYHLARSGEGYQQEKYPEYVPLEDFQAKPDVKVPPLAHSSSEMLGGKSDHISKKVKKVKFDDEDDLLS